jgi:ADP-heptose:LPS heptosyltransferase
MTGKPSVAPHVLAARLDSAGDVLLAGPAIRAIAARAEKVTALCGRRGIDAMRLLPGIDDIVSWTASWIDPEPEPVSPRLTTWLVEQVARRQVDEAVIFTSFHQSPLPLALLLRLAGVRKISAISEDFAGSLLDVRHHVKSGAPEAERALSLAAAAGFPLPEDDDGRLAVRSDLPDVTDIVAAQRPYIVVHPGASATARAWPAEHCAALVAMLSAQGWLAVVTGSENERALTGFVAGADGLDLGGRVSFAELAQVIRGAGVIVVGNTGPAHLAAAVGTPVVSLFAPTVPASAWRPYRVPHIVLGNQSAPCRNTRARTCPIAGHPCLRGVTPDEVMAAAVYLAQISGRGRRPLAVTDHAMTGNGLGAGGAL